MGPNGNKAKETMGVKGATHSAGQFKRDILLSCVFYIKKRETKNWTTLKKKKNKKKKKKMGLIYILKNKKKKNIV